MSIDRFDARHHPQETPRLLIRRHFSHRHVELVENPRAVWLFGYGHLPLFASVAAVGSALAAAVDIVGGDAVAQARFVAVVLALAVSVIVLVLAGLHALSREDPLGSMTPALVVSIACILVGLVSRSMTWAVFPIGVVLILDVARLVRASQGRAG